MFRFLFSSNHKLLTSIAGKWLQKTLCKSVGLKSTLVTCNDVYFADQENGKILVHFNGDILLEKEELLKLLDRNIDRED